MHAIITFPGFWGHAHGTKIPRVCLSVGFYIRECMCKILKPAEISIVYVRRKNAGGIWSLERAGANLLTKAPFQRL